MGHGLMSADTAATVALGLIRRGFRYVPVTYTGIAFLNLLKFVFAWRAVPAHDSLRIRAETNELHLPDTSAVTA